MEDNFEKMFLAVLNGQSVRECEEIYRLDRNKFVEKCKKRFPEGTEQREKLEKVLAHNKSEQNKLMVNIEYQDKNKIICMYTDTVNIIENGQETVLFENKNKKITAQSINLHNNFVTVQEESSGIFSANSVVNIMDIDTKNTKNYTVETSIKEIYTKGDIIALNLGTEVEFINTGGWLVKRYVASQEVTNVTVSDNIVGIIYRDKVEIISL